MNTQNPTQSELESRIEQLESACEDLTAQRDELCEQLTSAIKVAVKANDAYDKAIQRGDELRAALKPLLNAYVGAIGIADPADDALCLNASYAIAKAESNQT